jgi:uncharacterized protein
MGDASTSSIRREAGSPFHSGEIEAQARGGVGAPPGAGIRDFMPDQHRQFFAMLSYVVIANFDAHGSPMATILTGPPGFIESPDPQTLSIAADPDGNDPVLSSLNQDGQVGLLGIDLSNRRRNRANGRIISREGMRVRIAVEQSFGNCAKYIQTREIDHIAAHEPHPAESLVALNANDRALIERADTFFVATSTGARSEANGGLDVSHRGGRPGFVRIDGDTLTIPDFKGNRFFNTFGNLLVDPRAALLFVDFERGDLLHLQGVAEIVWHDEAEILRIAGAERLWRFRVIHGLCRPAAIPLRWRFREFAPTTAATGSWVPSSFSELPSTNARLPSQRNRPCLLG